MKKKKDILGDNYFVAAEWNFASFKKALSQKFNKLALPKLNEFIEKLMTFKRIFSQINPSLLHRNGFSLNIIERYKPSLEDKLFQAFVLKSDLLDKEQLPGQTKMFAGLGLPFDNARQLSQYDQEGTTYIRQEKLSKDKLVTGRECEISFTVSKVAAGVYVIIEAEYLQPSHIGNMQNPLHFIPEAQPRNRSMSQSGHSTPKIIAENLRPSEIIEGATAYTGAPIINPRGEIVQGNGRGYTMKFYYSNYPTDPAGYKKWISKNGIYYGFTAKQIEKFKHPVIARMVDVSDKEAIELGQYTQKDLEAVASETTQVKSKAGLITIEVLDKIIDELLRGDTGDKSLPELIRDSDILKVLIKENIIRADDMELYKRNDVINETGVNFITKLLLNLIFKESDVNTPDVFATLPVALQKAIEKGALYILKCRNEQNINKEIGLAIIGLRDYLQFKANGSIKEWKKQIDIFGGTVSDKYNELEFRLIEIFADTPTQKQIVEYFKKYALWATDQPGDMFSEPRPACSKAVAVEKVFGIDLIDSATEVNTKATVVPGKEPIRKVQSKATVVPEVQTKKTVPALSAKTKALALEIELELLDLMGLGRLDDEITDRMISLYEKAMIDKTGKDVISLGKLSSTEINFLKNATGIDFSKFRRIVDFNGARHTYKFHGGNHEKLSNQIPVEPIHFAFAPKVISEYDTIKFQPKGINKRNDTILYTKKIGKTYFVVEEIITGENKLRLHTMWIKK